MMNEICSVGVKIEQDLITVCGGKLLCQMVKKIVYFSDFARLDLSVGSFCRVSEVRSLPVWLFSLTSPSYTDISLKATYRREKDD